MMGSVRNTSKSCGLVALRRALENTVLPIAIITDHLGVVQGLAGGESHRASDKNPNTDEGKNMSCASHKIEDSVAPEKQLVGRNVKGRKEESNE